MSLNGSGTAVINSAGQPVVANTLITATAFNALTADLATMISTAIMKDGQTTITGNIPFNNKKITGLAVGTARTDAASLATIQDGTGVYVPTVGGTADVITLTPSPAITAYAAGQTFRFIASGANTTNVTVAISGLTAKAITKHGTTALAAGDIPSGTMVHVTYDGTRFILGAAAVTAEVAAALAAAADNVFRVVGSGDATKKLAFEVDGLTTATTRTVTVPDRSGNLTLDPTVATYNGTANLAAGVGLAILTGASFALTLPTVASSTNREVDIIHKGTSLTATYTITGNGAETITAPDGVTNTYVLYTTWERIRLKCDGATWYLVRHDTTTEWNDVGVMTITGTTSDPTKPTTPDIDKVYWRREGNHVYLRYLLQISSATGSAAGSGSYLWALPTNIAFENTALTPVATSMLTAVRSESASSFLRGSGMLAIDSTNESVAGFFAYDTTHFQVQALTITDAATAGNGNIGHTDHALTNAESAYVFELNARAANWRL